MSPHTSWEAVGKKNFIARRNSATLLRRNKVLLPWL